MKTNEEVSNRTRTRLSQFKVAKILKFYVLLLKAVWILLALPRLMFLRHGGECRSIVNIENGCAD